MKAGRGGREEEGGCQRPKIERQRERGREEGGLEPGKGRGELTETEKLKGERERKKRRAAAVAASTHVILPSSLKEKRCTPPVPPSHLLPGSRCSLKDEEGNRTRGQRDHGEGEAWMRRENIRGEEERRVKGRSQKEGERPERREGDRSEGERGLLWIVICHVHPPACSYTRVLLLILNRC